MASGRRKSGEPRLDQPIESSRGIRPAYDSERFGRLSERVARYIGSWAFIAWMSVVIIAWLSFNVFAPDGIRPDAYPFIFLTLLLSLQASYAAPLILLAQIDRPTETVCNTKRIVHATSACWPTATISHAKSRRFAHRSEIWLRVTSFAANCARH